MSLSRQVRTSKNLELAWRVILKNGRASDSPDVRGEIEKFAEDASGNLRSLQRRLSLRKFRFPLARGIPIKKVDHAGKATGKIRPIVLAPLETRIVQRAILNVLTDCPGMQRYLASPFSFGGIRKSKSSLADRDAAVPGAIDAVLNSILARVREGLETSVESMRLLTKGSAFDQRQSLIFALKRMEGRLSGWRKHYWFCNDTECFSHVNDKIGEIVARYLGAYRGLRSKMNADRQRMILGITDLRVSEKTPFKYPSVGRT